MGTLVFICPVTGRAVQGLVPEEETTDPDIYHTVDCLACGQVHLVNPITGRVLRPGEE
jgi:hypothetical protein